MARRDYFYDPDAPKPNSIRPAAAVALFDSGGNILLLRRKDNDKWSMPGGTLDFGETLTYCAIREVREETGLRIRITGLIGTYTDPNILIAYSDGLVEPENVYGEEFGITRLKDAAMRLNGSTPRTIALGMMQAVEDWAGTPEQADDMTVIVARMR